MAVHSAQLSGSAVESSIKDLGFWGHHSKTEFEKVYSLNWSWDKIRTANGVNGPKQMTIARIIVIQQNKKLDNMLREIIKGPSWEYCVFGGMRESLIRRDMLGHLPHSQVHCPHPPPPPPNSEEHTP